MIPIRLTIEGLYSYQERQTIDFAALTAGGLFGIFGATGSGKSSILEAISYVLYGETERMNAREGRNYNMMNLKSDRAFIDFEFRNYQNRLFRATRELRRNSKRFDDVRPPKAVMYREEHGTWVPLDHTDAAKVIGLSYDNFKRTIIIPQGQFREFLELGAADRTRMMKEIFQLHRFDLQDKVRLLTSENNSKLDQAEGQLKGYEAVSKEEIETRESRQKEQEVLEKEAAEEHRKIDDRFRQLKLLKSDYADLKEKEKKFSRMEKQVTDIEETEQKLFQYERFSKIFGQLLRDSDRGREKMQTHRKLYETAGKELEKITEALKNEERELDKILPWYEDLTAKRAEENELEIILKLLVLQEELKNADLRTEKGRALVKGEEEKSEKVRKDILQRETRMAEWKSNRMDTALVSELRDWFAKQDALAKDDWSGKVRIENFRKELSALMLMLEKKEVTREHFSEKYDAALQTLEQRKRKLEEQRNELEVRRELARYAHELHEGEPCPLCGSTEHPEVNVPEDVSSEIGEITGGLQSLEEHLNLLRKEKSEMERVLENIRFLEKQLSDEEKAVAEVSVQVVKHRQSFRWEGFHPDRREDFEEKLKLSSQNERRTEEAEKELMDLRKKLDEHQNNQKKYREGLEKIRMQAEGNRAAQKAYLSGLRVLNYENFKGQPTAGIEDRMKNLKLKNDRVETDYRRISDKIRELTTQKASGEARLNGIREQWQTLEEEVKMLNKEIATRLRHEQIEEVQLVQIVLAAELDPSAERDRIQKFRHDFELLSSRIQDLTGRLKAAAFDFERFGAEEEKWKKSADRLKEINEAGIVLRQEIIRLKKQLEEKQKLLEVREQLFRRGENLRIMSRLFTGSGFVEYVSTIYLSQLCDLANVRFQRMTRNQLSLRLGANNDFEIVDYLNEGRCRSVKTLSGGQSFQVSLALALALAESVQANTLADKNFFFIDEGFGTQDPESINIIFETLLHLNKENKIVGIISHVDELKDRIPLSLTVKKDAERGSLVTPTLL